jgi:hypothetical protein
MMGFLTQQYLQNLNLSSKILNKTDFITRTLMDKKKENALGQVIRIAILGWSAALLTASYAGALSKMDPTFIATVFTASAATFGINTMKKGGDEEDEKKAEPKREEFVETPPEPPAPEAAAPSLEERVEALEEGQVQPRTPGA